jgi:hypothetical protein
MSEPQISPDGKWIWDGSEWISANKLVDARDGVIVGDIQITQTFREPVKCPECNSISTEIRSCRLCSDLFSCNVCKDEIDEEKKAKIRIVPKVSNVEKIPHKNWIHHPKIGDLAEKHLDRTCKKCFMKYLNDNDLPALSKIMNQRNELIELCDFLFEVNNYIWPRAENNEWPPHKYEMMKSEEYYSITLGDMGEILPITGGLKEPLNSRERVYSFTDYFIHRMNKLRQLMWHSFETYKQIERKSTKSMPSKPLMANDDTHLLMLQYSKYSDEPPHYMLQMDSYFRRTIQLNSDLSASETYPYSEVRNKLFKEGWTFDFELDLGELTYRNVPTVVMCFFRH